MHLSVLSTQHHFWYPEAGREFMKKQPDREFSEARGAAPLPPGPPCLA